MKRILLFFIFLTLLALTLNPIKYSAVCYSGIRVWAITVLPALLPFIFLTTLICALQNLNGILKFLNPVCKFLYRENAIFGYVQIMSFISGYPIGAKLVAEFYERGLIDETQAKKISVCASTSGPAFIISSVGGAMLVDKTSGIVLYLCHVLSAVFIGVIYRKQGVYQPIAPLFKNNVKSDNLLYECALNTFTSCLVIGVFIAFAFVLLQIAEDFKLLYPLIFLFTALLKDQKKATAFSAGLIECTKGCLSLAQTSGFLQIPLICAIITFGGACVIFQSFAFLKKAKVKLSYFLFGKLLQTAIAFLLCAATLLALG